MSFPGGSAQYACHALPLNSLNVVKWYVNGSLLENITNVESQFQSGIGTLKFTDIPVEFNGTRIGCEIVLTSSVMLFQEASLTLQGYSYVYAV